ncbi:unnamed protein product, partial [marine sediment metagenome]
FQNALTLRHILLDAAVMVMLTVLELSSPNNI